MEASVVRTFPAECLDVVKISNFSESNRPILFTFHILHLKVEGTNSCVVCCGRIAMATYSIDNF